MWTTHDGSIMMPTVCCFFRIGCTSRSNAGWKAEVVETRVGKAAGQHRVSSSRQREMLMSLSNNC